MLLPYWNRRSEFTIEQDCLLWGICMVIQQKWQEITLGELHRDHPGRDCLYERSCLQLLVVGRNRQTHASLVKL